MKKLLLQLTITLITVLSFLTTSQSQFMTGKAHDYLMPVKGKSMVELYSGIPYVAIGQYSYGFSHRFSAGVLYGTTPFVVGYGLRLKAILLQPSSSFRVYAKSPIIYYPHMREKGSEPWALVWPTINAEWKFRNESRIWLGYGLIGVACIDEILGREEFKEGEMEKSMAARWNTMQIGYSKPLSKRTSFVIEAAPVMKGFRFVTPHGLLDGIPVIGTFGLSITL